MSAHVYVIKQDGDHGPVKIGMARSPQRRLLSLQTGNHRKLTIAHAHPCSDKRVARRIEGTVHDMLNQHAVAGEWYAVSVRVAVEAICAADALHGAQPSSQSGSPFSTYLERNGLTDGAFAKLIGVSQPTVFRYRNGRIPTPDVMQKIVEATAGSVTPNDFFGLPEAKAS